MGDERAGGQGPVSVAVAHDPSREAEYEDGDERVGEAEGCVSGPGPILVAAADDIEEQQSFPCSVESHVVIKIDTDAEGEGLAAVVEAAYRIPRSNSSSDVGEAADKIPTSNSSHKDSSLCSLKNDESVDVAASQILFRPCAAACNGESSKSQIELCQLERRNRDQDKLFSILESAMERIKNLQNEDGDVDGQTFHIASQLVFEVTRSFSPHARDRLVRSFMKDDNLDHLPRGVSLRELFEKDRDLDAKLNKIGEMIQCKYEERMRQQQGLWKSLLWTTIAPALSGVALYLIGYHMESEEGSAVWNAWAVLKVAGPTVLFVVYSVLQQAITEKEKYLMKYPKNTVVNFRINAISKAAFFGIKDYPGLKNASLWARIVTFVIDFVGACFLWWKNGYYEPDVPDT